MALAHRRWDRVRRGGLVGMVGALWLLPAQADQTAKPSASGKSPAASAKDLARAAERNQRACDAKDWGSCYDLGVAYEHGTGVVRDPQRAAALYTLGCDAGDKDCCAGLAVLLTRGEGVEKDPARAAQLVSKPCDAGSAKACYLLGSAYSKGNGVAADPTRALALFNKSCDGGFGEACAMLGTLYAEGSGGVAKDAARAAAFDLKGCNRGSARACTNLGVSYDDGLGVAQDRTLALQYTRRGCEGGSAAGCLNLGNAYEDGIGISQDLERAAVLFKSACDLGSTEACSKVEARRRVIAATGGDGDLRSLALFGVPLKGAKRAELRSAFAKAGLQPTREENKYWVDLYAAQGVLRGSTVFRAWYVAATGRFAFASYDFENAGDEPLLRITRILSAKYGSPSSRAGNLKLGPVRATWLRPDGLRVEVVRDWPERRTQLTFIDPAAKRQMDAEIAAADRARDMAP
jgi:TPR repeat protein